MGHGNRALQIPFLLRQPLALNLDLDSSDELHLCTFDLNKMSSTVSWNWIHQSFGWEVIQSVCSSNLQHCGGGGYWHCLGRISIRQQQGLGYPARVAGTGTGNDSPTRDLQNESKNIIFGPELSELQLISWNSSKLAVTHSFLGRFGCFWTCFDGYGYSTGRVRVARAIPLLLPNLDRFYF